MEKKNIRNITIIVVAVALIIAVLGGGTFAYWQWISADEDQTIVNVTVEEGISMTINPTTVTLTNMRPTNDCDGDYAMIGTATITIDNQTGILAQPTFKLKAKSSKNLTANAWSKLNFAITEDGGSCSSPLYQGTFTGGSTTANTWTDTAEIPRASVTFDAFAYNNGTRMDIGEPTEHVYDVYVWIDSSYVATNQGTTVSDVLQDNTITVTWSENSVVEQVLS